MYFLEHKLAIEVDEIRYKVRNKYKEIERQRAIEKELNCEFIRINPDEEDFDMYDEIGKIYIHINKSSKKSLIDRISKKTIRIKI